MSSSETMQQAKTEATQAAQRQQSNASAVQSEFADLRPQATAQRQLQEAADNSPQSHQLNSFQQMAKNSARSMQLKAMSVMMNAPAVQRAEEDDDPLQAKSATETAQREAADAAEAPKPNNTGLPDQLKSGIESLSGMSMDHVKVHYNSAQPAQLNAHAYAQGSEIHVAPGQEQHLPHEAWHVVQQAQGRVKPTMQMKVGVPINDDAGLESEADVMGAKAVQLTKNVKQKYDYPHGTQIIPSAMTAQMAGFEAHLPDEELQPDQIGGEHGTREISEDAQRPDDVPVVKSYRLAIHRLHDVILLLPKNTRYVANSDAAENTLAEIMSKAKSLAKDYKTAIRTITGNANKEAKNTYREEMNKLAELANNASKQMNPHASAIDAAKGENKWREQWVATRTAVNNAIRIGWGTWQPKLKESTKAKTKSEYQKAKLTKKNAEKRADGIDAEAWNISYGGSLAKGYKGPPKQQVRFMKNWFDVDASMVAPALAELMINDGAKVDRGQVHPGEQDTHIKSMDKAMHSLIVTNMVEKDVAPSEPEAEALITEPFETFVNTDGVTGIATTEVERSSNEQEQRDRLTAWINKRRGQSMLNLKSEIAAELEKASLKNAQDGGLITRALTPEEVEKLENIIDDFEDRWH